MQDSPAFMPTGWPADAANAGPACRAWRPGVAGRVLAPMHGSELADQSVAVASPRSRGIEGRLAPDGEAAWPSGIDATRQPVGGGRMAGH